MEIGPVSSVRAESFGEPGQRRFRLLAETHDGKVSLWLEKEQVVMLGSAIVELLDQVPERISSPMIESQSGFVGEFDVKVGSLAVAFDSAIGAFRVEAGDFLSPFDLASISFIASREQFSEIRDQIETIVAGSRPRCVLCGTPLTGDPHFCPESNGHARLGVMES